MTSVINEPVRTSEWQSTDISCYWCKQEGEPVTIWHYVWNAYVARQRGQAEGDVFACIDREACDGRQLNPTGDEE